MTDLKLSRVQEQVTKVGHILVKNTEHLLRAKFDSNVSLDDPVRMNIDALAVLGHAAHELTKRRRKATSHTCIKIIARYAQPLSQLQNFVW